MKKLEVLAYIARKNNCRAERSVVIDDLVYLKNEQAVCDSLQVAEKFGKRHSDVIRAIENLLANDSTQNCVHRSEASDQKEQMVESIVNRVPVQYCSKLSGDSIAENSAVQKGENE